MRLEGILRKVNILCFYYARRREHRSRNTAVLNWNMCEVINNDLNQQRIGFQNRK